MADPGPLDDDDLIKRLEHWSIPEPNSGCLLWLGAVNRGGYGITTRNGRGKSCLAHRAAYELWCGPIPAGLYVCHKCDVRSCINPDHLWIGTKDDNSRDMTAKGRQSRGERRPLAKLTAEKVRQIRASDAGMMHLGRVFGVNESLIRQVRLGLIWRHVDG